MSTSYHAKLILGIKIHKTDLFSADALPPHLKCPSCAHEYPNARDFKYCPFDGEPLKLAAVLCTVPPFQGYTWAELFDETFTINTNTSKSKDRFGVYNVWDDDNADTAVLGVIAAEVEDVGEVSSTFPDLSTRTNHINTVAVKLGLAERVVQLYLVTRRY